MMRKGLVHFAVAMICIKFMNTAALHCRFRFSAKLKSLSQARNVFLYRRFVFIFGECFFSYYDEVPDAVGVNCLRQKFVYAVGYFS